MIAGKMSKSGTVGAVAAMGRLAHELEGFKLHMGYSVFPDDDVPAGELIDLARDRIEPWAAQEEAEREDAA